MTQPQHDSGCVNSTAVSASGPVTAVMMANQLRGRIFSFVWNRIHGLCTINRHLIYSPVRTLRLVKYIQVINGIIFLKVPPALNQGPSKEHQMAFRRSVIGQAIEGRSGRIFKKRYKGRSSIRQKAGKKKRTK